MSRQTKAVHYDIPQQKKHFNGPLSKGQMILHRA